VRTRSTSPPDVSIIVPARDVAPFVRDTLGALAVNICAPAAPRTEVIAVDDGSTDDTSAILADAAATFDWLTVIRHNTPIGLAGARNAGLAVSSGRLLTFLDGDDWYGRGHLAALVAAIDGSGVDFVRVGHVKTYGRRRRITMPPEHRRNVALDARSGILPVDESSMVDYPYMWAGIYRRSLYEAGLLSCHEQLHTAEDRPWVWRLHREAGRYLVADLHGVFYRRGVPAALTAVGDRRQLHYLDAFALVFAELADDPDVSTLTPKAVRSFCAIAAHHLGQEDRLAIDVRAEHRRRVGEALAALPADELAGVLAAVDPKRAAILNGARLAGGARTRTRIRRRHSATGVRS
jgi:glycosyltransferase involved in cell wall biosynthesis